MRTRKIYKVQMIDNSFRLYDEHSRIAELTDLSVKEIYPIETGVTIRTNHIGSGFLLIIPILVLITFGLFGFLPDLSSVKGETDNLLVSQSPEAIAASKNSCNNITDSFKQGICYQGFRQWREIKRSQIPLDATRVKINGFPNLIAFKDGDTLLVVY